MLLKRTEQTSYGLIQEDDDGDEKKIKKQHNLIVTLLWLRD
jgi:hypothetical protein